MGFGEARRHFRPMEKLRWPVVVAVAGTEEPTAAGTTLAMTRGVSVGGAFVETELAVEVGQDLRLWLHPPGPVPPGQPHVLRLSAQVRWLNRMATPKLPKGFGVEFRALSAAEEVALHAYVSAPHKVV